MIFQRIEYIPLTAEEKKQTLEILAKGNILLKKWAKFYPTKKYRQFRNAVMAGVSNPDNRIPADKLGEFKKDLPTMRAIRHQAQDHLNGRSVEMAILQGFSAMAENHARRWAISDANTGLELIDFLQESYIQVIEATYSWLPEYETDIGTFIWIALKNRLSNVANQQGNLFGPLTNTDLALMIRYNNEKSALTGNFEQIVEKLCLSDDECRQLTCLLTRVYTENQMPASIGEKNRLDAGASGNDYTAQRQSMRKDETAEGSQHVYAVLERANLTPMERELIETAMNSPSHGWQTQFAADHINPTTKKPYSRMRITQILESARAKLKRVIETAESEAA